MSLIHVHYSGGSAPVNDEYISKLWNVMCMVRSMPNNPLLWKLTNPFVDAIAKFYHIDDYNKILCLTFLDASIDITSQKSILICEAGAYPVDWNDLRNE